MKAKILSMIEVSVVFVAMIFLFRYVSAAPLAAEASRLFPGRLFPGYAVLLIVSLLIYFFQVLRKPQSPLSEKLKYQLSIAAKGFFPIFTLSVLLNWINWRQWGGAVLISAIEIGLLVWLAMAVKDRPAWQSAGVVGSLLLFPLAAQISIKLTGILLNLIYFYLFVAFGEEVLFRGYIQSRLNAVFGRPHVSLGINWGWGLILSSVFFGLWHLGWNPGALDWPHVLWTMFAGLLFGAVREKSESVIAPAILHGIMNYGPQAILYALFWAR